MKNRLTILLAALAILTAGCDRKDTKDTSEPQVVQTTQISTPAPAPDPIPPPSPEPSDNPPAEAGSLNLVAVFPGPDEPRVALVSPVRVQFDRALIQGLDLDGTMRVESSAGPVQGAVTLADPRTLVFRSYTLWQPSTVYTVTLDTELMSAEGLSTGATISWQFSTVADVYTTPQVVIDECMSDLDVEMLAAVNQARTTARNCGENPRPAVGKLVWNCRLQQAAISHSEDMASTNFFGHTGSDGSNVADRISRTGYLWSRAGENLAAGHKTVTRVMEDLLASPGHCENIMSPHYTEFGFGFRSNNDTDYVRYWTQNFALPIKL